MKYLSIIEKYFLGKLEGNELKRFLEDRERDSDLKEEFEIYQRIFDFVKNQEEEIINRSKEIADFEFDPSYQLDIEKYGGNKPQNLQEEIIIRTIKEECEETFKISLKKSLFYQWLKISAILILLISLGVAGIYIFPKYSFNDEELFNKYFTPYAHLSNTRSVNQEMNYSVREGFNLYDKGDYKSAIFILSNIADSLKNNPEIFIVEGVSLIKLKKYEEAISRFELIDENSYLYPNSLWYQGLCYLILNDKNMAKEIFKQLKSTIPFYQKESKKLLRYL